MQAPSLVAMGPAARPLSCSSWSYLNNGGDCILVRDEFGTISDSVAFDSGAGQNRSLERNELEIPGLPDWNPSQSPTGATPCASNSVLPAPAAYDAGFVEGASAFRKDSSDVELIHVHAVVANSGYRDLPPFAIDIFNDINHNGISSDDEFLASVEVDSLASGDAATVEFSLRVPTGRHLLILQLPTDERPDNNYCQVEITSGALTREVIVTEFLADPSGRSETEWIELRNIQ